MTAFADDLQRPEGKVGLDDPMWDEVYQSIEKSYQDELEKKRLREAESARLRSAQETDQLLRELGARLKSLDQRYPSFDSQPAQNQYDPYAEMQKQMQGYQQQEAQRTYQDEILGRNQGSTASGGYTPSTQSIPTPRNTPSNSNKKPAGFSYGNTSSSKVIGDK